MKYFKLMILFFILFTLNANATQNKDSLEKVSVQLQWLDQFQFAGYYMAKDKGFYRDVGLDVEIKKYKLGLKTIDEVTSMRATYGIGRPALIIDRSQGKKIILLSALFQSSPLVLLARADSNISSVKDFVGKTVMATFDDTSVASIEAMLKRYNIKKSELNIIPYSYEIDDLISGKTDLMTAYRTNQAYRLEELGVDYKVFDPTDYGFDIYADLLFTSEYEVHNHRQRAKNFRDATHRGWKYAFEHVDETVSLIKQKYNGQNKSLAALRYEAKESEKLAYFNQSKLGDINQNKIQRIYDIYNIMGLVQNEIDIDDFILKNHNHFHALLSNSEKEYLKNKKEIFMCVSPDSLPYSKIDNSEYIGMGADYMKLISQKIDTTFTLIPTESLNQSLQFAKEHKCDVLPLFHETSKRKEYLMFSKEIFSKSLVIATKNDKMFISDIKNILNKRVGIAEGDAYKKLLKERYPKLNLIEVKSDKDGLAKVESNNLFAYIGDLASVAYEIQRNYSNDLKVSGTIAKYIETGIGVRNDDMLLLNILNKAIDSISEEQVQEIYNAWVSVKYENGIDYKLIWQLVILFIVILSVISFFLIKQNRLKNKIEILNARLEAKIVTQVQEIKQSTLMLETIFDTVRDGIAILDLNSNFLLVNNAYKDITGFTKEELYKKSCLTLTVPSMIEESKKVIMIAIEKGYYWGYEKQCVIKDDKIIDVIVDMILMPDKKSILMVIKDITRKKQYEQKKKLQEDQILHQSKLVQMGEMISMIAHQWRQPLGAISATAIDLKMQLELESYNLEEVDGREACQLYFNNGLGNIESFTQNLTATIDDFRSFYKKNKESKFLDINEPIQKALNIVRTSMETSNINLLEEYKSSRVLSLFDSELMQVVLNIIKNAEDNFKVKETLEATIWVSTQDTDDGILLTICDNGGGIDKEIMQQIFEPYFSTKYEKNGTGLGLYMSKIIIEEHHRGTLSAFNKDMGVCFSIELFSEE